jgi:hypothetical protein
MHWAEFETAAPELAALARERFTTDQVILLGTIRRDGSPRISPVEPDIADGRLYLGMIWGSYKARDLQRDPRCVVHGLIHDRFATGGEIKLHGKAIEIRDLEEREVYREAIFQRIGWKPDEPKFHLFAIDIQRAAKFSYEADARKTLSWREGEPIRKYLDYMDGRLEEFD